MSLVHSFFFYLFLWLVRVTPAFVYFPFARAGVRIFYALSRTAKRNARETLTTAFGDSLSLKEKERLARASFLNLADGLAGFIFTFRRPALSKDVFEFEGLEKVSAAVSKGKGAVIGVAHFGPFAWMIFRFIAEGYRASVVAKPPRGAFLKEKFRDSFRHTGVNVILSTPVRTCIVESIRAIEEGQLLFMPVDQNYGAAGRVFVRFFGKPAGTAPGPVVYAQKTGVPLFMAFALPLPGNKKFKIVIQGPLELAQTGDERADLMANTQKFTSVVEERVRQFPEQWSWLHRRWKCVPRENEPVYAPSRGRP